MCRTHILFSYREEYYILESFIYLFKLQGKTDLLVLLTGKSMTLLKKVPLPSWVDMRNSEKNDKLAMMLGGREVDVARVTGQHLK